MVLEKKDVLSAIQCIKESSRNISISLAAAHHNLDKYMDSLRDHQREINVSLNELINIIENSE